jgi:predicted transcriptional regulator of viral defense system
LGLLDVASGQAGYFTAEQARSCGFSRALIRHHAKTGRLSQIRHGLYRLREYPSSPRGTRAGGLARSGKEAAVISLDSALDLLDRSDIIPDVVHLTVPRSRRETPSIPGVKVHTTDRPIGPGEREHRDGVVVTSATRSILDAACKGADPEQIQLAVAQAIERGLATNEEMRRAASELSRCVAKSIFDALGKAVA